MEKIFRKDLEDSEKVLTFAARKEVSDDREASERVLEVFEAKKILKKDLEVSKKVLTFAPLSAEKKRRSAKGRGGVIGAPQK